MRIGPRPQLEVRDLEVALHLARAGSTTGAAATLHVTQSAVSRALCLAEEKLGVKLFERRARGLVPTPAGERLLAGAGPLLAQLVELEQSVAAPLPVTRLRLVCECYTAYRWLPSTLAHLRRTLPRLELALAIEHTRDPVAALRAGDIDIALLTTGRLPNAHGPRAELKEAPLFADEIVFVVARDHPLAKKATLTKKDLTSHPLITSPTPPAEARWFVESVFGRSKPAVDWIRFPLTEAIVDAARASMGIAVLSEWMATGYLDAGDLVVKRLQSGPLRRPWRIAYRRDSEPVAARIVDALGAAAPRLYTARTG